MPVAGPAREQLRRMENGPWKGGANKGRSPAPNPSGKARNVFMLCCSHSRRPCCRGTPSLTAAWTRDAPDPTVPPGLAGRPMCTHTQRERGHLSQGQTEIAFGLPSIWLDDLHHCLRALLRGAVRGRDCPWCSRMTLWRAMTACVHRKMFDCHSFPHSGSAKLALWPVAGTHMEEPVTAGDFLGRPAFSPKQGFPLAKLYRMPSRLPTCARRVPSCVALLLGLSLPTYLLTLPAGHKKDRCQHSCRGLCV